MASLVESGKYRSISTTDTATNGFYVIMFTSEEYTLQDNTTIEGKIITAGELVVKQCLCYIHYTLIGILINTPNVISS